MSDMKQNLQKINIRLGQTSEKSTKTKGNWEPMSWEAGRGKGEADAGRDKIILG